MSTKRQLKAVPLDARDKQILKLLAQDPRTSIADIARGIEAQRDTVAYRIGRLERKGVISKYHAILEPQALGLPVFMLALIKMNPVAGETVQQFVEKLVAHPHVTHVSRLLGRYDYFVQIAAEDVVAFDTVLDDIKAMQPGAIADIEIANIIDGLKTDDFSGMLS